MSTPLLLAINGGSSSIRFALYAHTEALELGASGWIERIGLPGARMHSSVASNERTHSQDLPACDYPAAIRALLGWLAQHGQVEKLQAVGHRIVLGVEQAQPQSITAELLAELKHRQAYAPEHLPGAVALIEALREALPGVPQIACFDCGFHSSMPRCASLLPIPRRYQALGLRRYGFHGLSYAWLMEELMRIGDPAAQQGRVILAHLGNGASLAAVRDGQSIDTSMGLTPASGIPMSTRSGDLDPALASFLAEIERMDATQFQQMVNDQSGLLGLSGLSSDMRDLLLAEPNQAAAADAVAVFCYQVKKTIGAYAAALGGLDTLVFAGGIGEHAPVIRARCCTGLEFLGIELDPIRNLQNAALISSRASRIAVRVLATDETRMIARLTQRQVQLAS